MGLKKKYVDIVLQSGDLLRSILNDVLDYSKIGNGKIELAPRCFSLKDKILKLHQLYSAEAENKGLKFTYKIEDYCPEYLFMDNFRLYQVMANLVGNAIKYTNQGSVNILLSCLQDSPQLSLHFSVTDTGEGVPDSYKEKIFDRFVQVDNSAQRKGTGLGLAISSSLIDLMGGTIGLESQLGQGSKFWFKIPITTATPSQIEEFAQSNLKVSKYSRHDNCRALVVEDTATNRFLLSELLKNLGCLVSEAENGKVALTQYQEGAYDIIFMDCSMPIMDGYEATKHLRLKGCSTPIIAVTAHALTEELDKCMLIGMNDLIQKPFKRVDVQKALDRWHKA